MSCCPPEIQVNLSNAKVKKYLWEYADVEGAMNEEQQEIMRQFQVMKLMVWNDLPRCIDMIRAIVDC